MSDQVIILPTDSTGKKVDTSELTVGANTVERQRINISDPTTAAAHAAVMNSQPAGTEYGIVVREAQKGQQAMANSIPVVIASNQSVLTIQGNQPTATTGNITTAATVVGPVATTNMNVVTVSVHGTYGSVSFVFEVSDDGSTWYPILGARSDTGILELGMSGTQTNLSRSWDLPMGGFTSFRVRATAWSSGTAVVNISPQTLPYDPCPSSIMSGFDGTNIQVASVVQKNNQGITAVATQNLLDSGRTPIMLWFDQITAVTTEALATCSITKGLATLTAATNYTVTTGKTLRITNFKMHSKVGGVTVISSRVRLRATASGIAITSPAMAALEAAAPAGVTTTTGFDFMPIPDGLEIPSNSQIGISHISSAVTATVSAMLVGFEY